MRAFRKLLIDNSSAVWKALEITPDEAYFLNKKSIARWKKTRCNQLCRIFYIAGV